MGGNVMTFVAKTVLLPLGFNLSTLLRAVARLGVEPGDRILLIFPKAPSDLKRVAMADARGFFQKLNVPVKLEVHELPEDDFVGFGKRLLELINEEEELHVWLGGGVRAFTVYLTLLHAFGLLRTTSLRYELETSGVDREIDTKVTLRELLRPSSGEVLRILKERGGELAARDISQIVGKDKSVVSRTLRKLEHLGLIKLKGRFAKLSELGELFCNV